MISRSTPCSAVLIILLATCHNAVGQSKHVQAGEGARDTGQHEVPRFPYVPGERLEQRTGPGARIDYNGYVSVQVNVNAQGQNIIGDAANEPSIAVDPSDRRRMAIGWRQFDTIQSDFRQAGWAYTADGGKTWTFPGKIEPGVFRSDPVVDADSQGNFYYNSLTTDGAWDYWCHVFRSYDGGRTWDAGTYALGGDKQWQVIDTSGGIGDGHIYACWNLSYSICSGHFTRSTNGGASFESCTSVPGNPYWGTLSIGPNGELYVSGRGFLLARSSNAKFAGQAITWDLSTTVNLGGSMVMSAGPNPVGLLGQCWVDVDRGNGPNRGNIYLLCSVDPPGPDPLDVMFVRSTDGGLNWSAPRRINDDLGTGAWQWFGTMSVAPNGRIDAVWLDTRSDPGGYDSVLYYSCSSDGGLTWSANEALTPAFDPTVGWPQQQKMGDYFDMCSDDMGADLAYAATFNGEEDVYYLRIGDTCFDAGVVDLNRNKYGCESIAEIEINDCGLNVNNLVVDTVQITVDSTSEPAGEIVTLTETGEDTGVFSGTLTLSLVDAPGVLLVAEGDALTATYIDADDGEGHFDVAVVDAATVDCTPPQISDVSVTNIEPRAATIVFTTDEPARGGARHGSTCETTTQYAAQGGYYTTHAIRITGLTDDSWYFFTVEAEDEAGNAAVDDNQGDCYYFQTPDVPDFFTELFVSNNDLDNLSLRFTPNGTYDYYGACVEEITELPTNPTGGTTISLSDDDYQAVNVQGGQSVSLYGQSYATFYVGSNGYITFGSGDTDYSESLADHFAKPRIAGLFDDLYPPSGGTISWKQLEDRVAVTYLNVPEITTLVPNTFQIEMYFDGRIVVSYLAVNISDGLAGLSRGTGLDPDYYPTDLSAMGACGPKPPVAENGAVNTPANTPAMITLIATDDGLPEPPAVDFFIVSLPLHGTLRDPGAGPIAAAPYTLASGGHQVEYSPDHWYHGGDGFTFLANDGGTPPEGGDSNVAQILIQVSLPQPEPVLVFPLDADPGWSTQGQWAFGQPTGGGSHNLDPVSGFTGPYVYGYNLNGDYGRNMPAYYLTTSALDCSRYLNTSFRFRRWLGVERQPFDTAAIGISTDGVNWTTLWENGAVTIADPAWTLVSFDISNHADLAPTVFLRWQMGPTDASTTYPGWNIDDIEIWAVDTSPQCFGDLDGDLDVDIADLATLLGHYGQTGVQYHDGDLNEDGIVNLSDLAALLAVYGTSCP